MASAITCDLCQSEPAEMMQSNLGNGETISVGTACMITFFAGALVGMVGQLGGPGRLANEDALAAVADAIGLLPADEVPPASPAELTRDAAGEVRPSDDHAAEGNHFYADGTPTADQERDYAEEAFNAGLGREE